MAGVYGSLAFVTGAGSGIGQATCRLLAKHGARIVAGDRVQKLASETVASLKDAPEHLAIEMDVSSQASVKSALKQAILKYNRPPRIVVNCAGITKDNFLLKMSEIDFDDVINVNLKGTFNVLQTCARAILEYNQYASASIVNVSSISGRIANIGQCNYNASKVGVEAITKTACKEFGKHNIRCNSVLPGFTDTRMTKVVPNDVKQKFLQAIPLQRFAAPEEIAEVIVFLASDNSSYVNGASIEVSGGLS